MKDHRRLQNRNVYWAICAFAIAVIVCLAAASARALDPDLARFVAAKRAQTTELGQDQPDKVPLTVWSFFDAVRADDWETSTNLAARLMRASGHYAQSNDVIPAALRTAIWPPISEVIGSNDQFHNWHNKWLHRFGKDIISSIPKSSIYFGGTDAGRFIISALCESQREGRPFFTVTQNQLADDTYLEYLRKMYGGKIQIPSREDSRKSFDEYMTDVRERLKADKLKPGEDVHIVNGQVKVSGQVAVMEINGLLAKIIVDKNPDRDFFIEESFPLDWMYPHLSPHGLIMQLHHEPLDELKEDTVQKDGDFWKEFMGELVGDWIADGTSMKKICDFADEVYLQKDLAEFRGDKGFIKNMAAQKTFSKLRTSIAALYTWRLHQAKSEPEKDRMRKAADLAFRQAFVCCPVSPEVVYRYTSFLLELNRPDDAMLMVETARRLEPTNTGFSDLLDNLHKRY